MNKDSELERIRSKVDIQDFGNVSYDEFERIQNFAAKGEISKEQLKLLVEVIPNFIQLQQKFVDGLQSVINSAKESQRDALRGISVTLENITDLLKEIVYKSESEALREKIADISLKLADYGLEIAKIIQETNKENNNTWKYVAASVSGVVLLVGGLLFRRK